MTHAHIIAMIAFCFQWLLFLTVIGYHFYQRRKLAKGRKKQNGKNN